MKRCLVKADDYGFTDAISLGILKAYREGIVRSTGVMVNMPAAPAALGWLREAEGLCLGLAYQHRRRKTGCRSGADSGSDRRAGRFPQL